jgi:hypothetical protein
MPPARMRQTALGQICTPIRVKIQDLSQRRCPNWIGSLRAFVQQAQRA